MDQSNAFLLTPLLYSDGFSAPEGDHFMTVRSQRDDQVSHLDFPAELRTGQISEAGDQKGEGLWLWFRCSKKPLGVTLHRSFGNRNLLSRAIDSVIKSPLTNLRNLRKLS